MNPERWRQIEELYHSALEREPGQRQVFLAEACEGDADLRSKVEALLATEDLQDTATMAVGAVVGTQIGVYRIDAPLGEGGMGTVFRAVDTKLNRPVAIKLLSDNLADAAARRRFQREAQMASSLNHPHILTVFDVGEFEGRQYLVTEFVDGGTLKDWSREEKRDWRQIVELLAGVADGLAAAHQAGILHRDIKPANILVAKNGYAKLADFGLAKLTEGVTGDATRTLTDAQTRAGTIVGTVAYMSPEQALGQPLDARSDVFSFGVVLYEMLAGRRPFGGATDLVVLKTIINGTPEPLGQEVPPALRTLIEKALEKDPADRYQSMKEMVVDLRRIGRQSGETATPLLSGPAVVAPRRSAAYVWTGIAAIAFLLIAGGAAYFYSAKSPVTSSAEWTQLTDFTDYAVGPVLSPDGRMVAFIRGGTAFLSAGQIYVKTLPNGESVKLTSDSSGAKYGLAFSPEGSRVAYTLQDGGWTTWTVPVTGGEPTRFLPNAAGLTWMGDGRLLYSEIMEGTILHMGIVTSTESRADERPVYFPPHERAMAHYSFASPDRKSALIVEMDRTATWQACRMLPLDGTSSGRQVGPRGMCTAAGWSPDGKWMYFSSSKDEGFGSDIAQRFGSSHLWRQRYPDGPAEQITFGPTEEEGVAVAPDGRSLITSVGIRRSEIWIHDADGDQPLVSEGFTLRPWISAEGHRVYYVLRQGSVSELWSMDVATGKTEHLVPGPSISDYEISRDDSEVVYTVQSGAESQIWVAALDRRSPPRLVTRGGDQPSFGADGELIFRALETNQNFLYRIKEDGSGRERILSTPIPEKLSVSPDGEWVTATIYVSQGNGDTVAIPVRGGDPRIICTYLCPTAWSPDGKFLYVTTELSRSTKGRTIAIPLPPGKALPDLPAAGITSRADRLEIPGIRQLGQGDVSVGNDPSTYVYTKQEFQGNLFRIPLH